jgi:prepilin-type processing-associated H-X9-DG protein
LSDAVEQGPGFLTDRARVHADRLHGGHGHRIEGAGAKAQSNIPVMLDAFGQGSATFDEVTNLLRFNHVPGGSNVLWMDGHVTFVRWGTFPLRDDPDNFVNGTINYSSQVTNWMSLLGGAG